MENPDLEDDGCPYRDNCVKKRVEINEVCIGSAYEKCLRFQEYEKRKADYVFDSLIG